MADFLLDTDDKQVLVVDKMRAIEVVVIVAMVMAFYTLLAKTETFGILPTPDITDVNSIRSEATEIYATVLTRIWGNSPVNAEQNLAVICEDAIRQARTPDDRLIILRLDDVQAWAWRDISIRVIEDTLGRDIPITLGVIPKDLSDDKVLSGYLRQKIQDHRVEIAQHGTSHSEAEFASLSKWEAIKLASSGREELVSTLGIKPVTFIPPENAYSEGTISAMKSLGFSVLSAGREEFEKDDMLQKIGYTTSTAETDPDKPSMLALPPDILDDCEKTSNSLKVCVIMIHPQDFAKADGSVDESKYASFTELLDRLETGKHYLFTTFKDLFVCTQENNAMTLDNNDADESIVVDYLPEVESPGTELIPIQSNMPLNGEDCVSYDKLQNTVALRCDATFGTMAAAMENEPVLRNEGDGVYTIDSSITVNDGATFTIQSPQVSWLRLEDRSSITVHGRMEVIGARISSWDSQLDSVIESEDGTVFRGWISFIESEGGIIKDSEISHLGYQSSIDNRAGFDLQSSRDLEITGSKFHDMYFAFYSNNVTNIKIAGNEYYSNILYALDPHSGTRDMVIANNHVHDNKGFGIICSLDCHDIIIEKNTVHDNGNAGIMLSRNTTNSIVRHNVVYSHPDDDGIVVSQSSNNYIYENTLTNNRQGIYIKTPTSSNNMIERNSIIGGNYGMVVAETSEGNVARGNMIEGSQKAEYYLLDSASLAIENSPFSKIRVEAGDGVNTISIRNSGEVFLFPTYHDTNTSPYTQTLTESSITLRGGLQGS